jgi:segregation and condensation protein A
MPSSLRDTLYQVHLPVFDGPLDLLLHLIEREKLDISTVSLAQVADQFLEYIRALEQIRAEALADFLIMAARLVWIKSRALLPQPARLEMAEEEDPGEALARQLRAYRQFKEAANALRAIEESGRRAYVRLAPLPELARRSEIATVTLADLIAAAGRAFAELPPAPLPVDSVVAPFTLTIKDQIRLIGRATAGGRSVAFRALLQNARDRLEIIVTLLAVLELIKRRQITVEQSGMFGEITIAPVAGVEVGVEEPEDGDAN